VSYIYFCGFCRDDNGIWTQSEAGIPMIISTVIHINTEILNAHFDLYNEGFITHEDFSNVANGIVSYEINFRLSSILPGQN
jgi:hypothetical protein